MDNAQNGYSSADNTGKIKKIGFDLRSHTANILTDLYFIHFKTYIKKAGKSSGKKNTGKTVPQLKVFTVQCCRTV